MSRFLILFLFVMGSAHAQSEGETDDARNEALRKEYFRYWDQTITPFYLRAKPERFAGMLKMRIHFRWYDREDDGPVIAFFPGQGEPLKKYMELAYDLYQRGYSIFMMDHRGHGASDPLTTPRDITHVNDFRNYERDVRIFLDRIVRPRIRERKLFLLGHSMGARILSGAVANIDDQSFISGIALNAPMFKINTKGYGYWPARGISRTFLIAGQGSKFSIEQVGFDPNEPFQGNPFTDSYKRFKQAKRVGASEAGLGLGGVSNQWINQALQATSKKKIKAIAAAIQVPVLMLVAGKDEVVQRRHQDLFAEVNKNCKVADYFPDAKHEILVERDAIRNKAIQEIDGFFRRFWRF